MLGQQPRPRAAPDLLRLLSAEDARQVVFVREPGAPGPDERLAAALRARMPAWQASLGGGALPLHRSPALFVWTASRAPDRRRLRQLRRLAADGARARFLLVRPRGRGSEAALRLAWRERLLDFTIAEPRGVHHFNPFSGEYRREAPRACARLFPDKLADLHGHELRVGVLRHAPYSRASCAAGSRCHFGFAYGELLRCLSRAANFRVRPRVADLAGYGLLRSDGSATGLIGQVVRAELDLLAFGAFLFHSPLDASVDRTAYVDVDEGCAVAPLGGPGGARPGGAVGRSAPAAAALVALVALVCLAARLLRLPDARLRRPLLALLLVLGLSAGGAPRALRSRLLYGSVMVVSLFYSSGLFARLASAGLGRGGTVPFRSYAELDASGLAPVLHPNLYNLTFGFADDEHLASLGRKAVLRADAADVCPRWLLASRNVSCVLGSLLAGAQVRAHRNAMAVGRPCFWSVTRSFVLPRASPYTQRFDRLIRRVEQSGLRSAWLLGTFHDLRRAGGAERVGDRDGDGKLDEAEVEGLLRDDTVKSARHLVAFGYALATCAFVGELLLARLRKRGLRELADASAGRTAGSSSVNLAAADPRVDQSRARACRRCSGTGRHRRGAGERVSSAEARSDSSCARGAWGMLSAGSPVAGGLAKRAARSGTSGINDGRALDVLVPRYIYK
ncbi:uncharacterized protein LOC131672929 isoform X2 [Phymastichus coffea]|uniref:uncharacterized protein LOC131672929 isoform X2 n=1 Tax=Phymastichus coffea TaxID=108790 RepID=UPI00273C0CC8|nr:uncharacterized protein LOC131672929 isoform X2 [Phymastichus coffea]